MYKKNTKYILSVIVPVYNVNDYLRKCIDSLINQRYKFLDIILIDDGSTDGSGEICDEYAEIDSRIRVIHQINSGVSVARNNGISQAVGEYITFVDSDDWIEYDMYDVMNDILTDTDIMILGLVRDYGIDLPKIKLNKTKKISSREALQMMLKHDEFSWELCDKIYRKSLWNDFRLDLTIHNGEDLLANWHIFNKAATIVLKNTKKYHYVQRGNSITHIELINKKILSYLDIFPRMLLSSQKSNKNELKKLYISVCISMGKRIVLESHKGLIQPYFYQIKKNIYENIIYILLSNDFRMKQKMGSIILLFPNRLLSFFNCLFVKK